MLADVHVAGYWYTRVLYSNLVVPKQHWQRALAVLVKSDTFCLQRPDMVLIQPSPGPSLHLRPDLSWLGVQFLDTDSLIAHAWRIREGILVPDPIDRLRILLGHALFQQRGLNLSQLLILWHLMHPGVVAAPRREAEQEGWQRGLDEMVANVEEAISLLDKDQPIGLPVPPPAPAFAGESRAISRLVRLKDDQASHRYPSLAH